MFSLPQSYTWLLEISFDLPEAPFDSPRGLYKPQYRSMFCLSKVIHHLLSSQLSFLVHHFFPLSLSHSLFLSSSLLPSFSLSSSPYLLLHSISDEFGRIRPFYSTLLTFYDRKQSNFGYRSLCIWLIFCGSDSSRKRGNGTINLHKTRNTYAAIF